jgi:3-oxoadipate enol-lactonase
MTEILNYQVKGEDRDLALLLIHPLGAELSFWDDFVEKIGGRFATVACDLRCSGKSFATTEPPSLADYAKDLEALRLHLGIQRVVPVGCAVGTMAAAAYAGNYPASTAALILANPTPSTSSKAKVMLTERVAVVARDGISAILPVAVERAFLSQPMDERYESYYRKFEGQDARAYALSTLSAANADATDYLKTVNCPALLVAGRYDVLLPLENARAVQALLPQSELLIAEDAAHFVPYQSADYFAETVCEWLRRKD